VTSAPVRPLDRGRAHEASPTVVLTDRGTTVRNAAKIAGVLLALAVVLGILGLILKALRWLLIIAAVVVLVAAAIGVVGKRREGADRP
jgi:hypothetical protein